MTTDRKIAANRKNAQKSTGPRTTRGRDRSSANAFRHGLAVAIGSDPSFSSDIENLASALELGRGRQTVGDFARQFAEAELDLLRIRKIRASQLNAVVSNPEALVEDYFGLGENLAKLQRYESRAYSRRKRAMRYMTSGF
jgi:hypothetical protein